MLPGLFKTADTVFCQKRIKLRIESETRKIETLNLRARGSGFIILCASIFSQDEEFEKPEPYSHTLTRDLTLEKPFYTKANLEGKYIQHLYVLRPLRLLRTSLMDVLNSSRGESGGEKTYG